MKIKDCGYDTEDLKNMGIGACRKVLNAEYIEGRVIYVASTPLGYEYYGYQRNTTRAYICKSGGISLLFYNLTPHRARKALIAYNAGHVGTEISAEVWHNYITNGYSTRRGLYADYDKQSDRIKQIARSHADYMGCETGDSTADHNNRVAMRNT